MPFKSKKQETYLKINEPKIYKEWKERYGTFKSDTLDNKNEQSKYMAQDKTGYEIPTDDNGSFYMQVRGDKEMIQKVFKDWKPKAYPYEKRITQDSLNITCENCGKENVHYQFYLPQKNSRYTRMRFVDGATHCKYDEGNCGANLCSDCADDNDCENCGAEMCSTCADESEYTDNHKICVPCREADEESGAETFGADSDNKLHAWATTMLSDVKLLIEDLENGAVYDLDDCRERLEKIRDDTSHLDAETFGAEYTIEVTGYSDGEPRRITGTEQELKDYLLDFHPIEDRMEYFGIYDEDEDEAMRLLKEKWNKSSLAQICEDPYLTLIETKEAPYAGLGSLFGFGQDTGLGSFTTSELTGSSAIHGDFDSASLNYSGHQAVFARAENEMKNVEFEDWAKQEMKTHGKDVSFKNWAKKEEKSHGNVELMDWAEHEEESHDERYGEKMAENEDSNFGSIGEGNNFGQMRAEEPMVEEPDFIPDGDGRALGQQTSSINLSPLHSESKLFNKTNTLIAGVIVIGLWKGKEILDMTMASLKRSAEEKRKGKACGSCNSQGSIRKTHTQVKNSEYSVDQVNPVEVQGQNDIHGAEGVTNPRHSPSSEPFGYPSKSLKMW